MKTKKQKTMEFLKATNTYANDKLCIIGVCILLVGIIVGFNFAPIKKGMKINVFSNNFQRCKKAFGYAEGNKAEGNSADKTVTKINGKNNTNKDEGEK